MIFHQIGGQTARRMTFLNKVSLILWIGASLALLSFFTFTLFVIAFVVGIVIFTLRFFRQNRTQTTNNKSRKNNPFTNQNYQSGSDKDDDIIDIWSIFIARHHHLNSLYFTCKLLKLNRIKAVSLSVPKQYCFK